ncbi:MAG TPA: Sua5/YciO/YrdC/YwlC family protein, partial [Actinomycetota bacterium]|nr:Sua5/YciO/YrdC/YwlC family protein [Actinomycetota bacterium]
RETVGVRVPDSEVARSLLSMTGPLAVTSANPSGEPTPGTCDEVRAALGEGVAVYVCAGAAPGGTPSTVVDLTGEPRILRAGPIPIEDLVSALERG